MDYRVASNIRGKSLSSMMADNITSGKSIGSSISGAISNKLKARATGIKEKFDPMNIAKFMTGGGRLAPAILGKITGRSQADINYFAGDKTRKESLTKLPSMMESPQENVGSSSIEVLSNMLAFMRKTHEENIKRRNIEKQFTEEKANETQRRHDEFLEVLKTYTSLDTTATPVTKKDEGNGILELLKNMVEGMIQKFLAPFKWLMDNKALLLNIFRLFGGPLAGIFAGGAAIVWLAEQLKDYFRENVADMKIIGPTEAANLLLNGNQKDIDKFPGGEKALRDIIENAPKRATEILARGNNAEILAAGGVDKLREIEKDIIAQPAKRDAMQNMKESVTPRAVFIEKGRGTKTTNAAKWDREFGPYYEPETGIRLDLVIKKEGQPATPTVPEAQKTSEPTATPVPPVPQAGAPAPVSTETQAGASSPVPSSPQAGAPALVPSETQTAGQTATPVPPSAPIFKSLGTTTATPLPEGVTPSTAGAGRGSINPPMVTPTESVVTPVQQTPVSSRMNDAVQENQTLNITANSDTVSPVAPVISTNNSVVDLPDKPISTTATVRDKTLILDHVLQMSVSPI